MRRRELITLLAATSVRRDLHLTRIPLAMRSARGIVPTPDIEERFRAESACQGLSPAEVDRAFLAERQPTRRLVATEDVAALIELLRGDAACASAALLWMGMNRHVAAPAGKTVCRSLKIPINAAIVGELQEIPTYLARIRGRNP